ncbi:DUF6527 family protein [Rhizobium leguminosarum]|uniref:DUF6527 family protein n=1 Tax=Rhizobium leguminosarum TaxID=384 RepID=UPI001C906D3C|nr:DUF6527 family protein [Rhizobium leguminosarum]MBY3026677.1 hypothetical protein [Rhizobium leguminosarum]
MMRYANLKHQFVEYFPEELSPGILYIAMEYGTASHRCCCGCGEEVVTPFTPTDWNMTYDGETVSLHPSIGNWNSACRSHYVVKRGKVIEAGPWSDDDVKAERERDRAAKAQFYGKSTRIEALPTVTSAVSTPPAVQKKLLARLWSWLSG